MSIDYINQHLFKYYIYMFYTPLFSVLLFVFLTSINSKSKSTSSTFISDKINFRAIGLTFITAYLISSILLFIYSFLLYLSSYSYSDYLYKYYVELGHWLNLYNINNFVLFAAVVYLAKNSKLYFYTNKIRKEAMFTVLKIITLFIFLIIILYFSRMLGSLSPKTTNVENNVTKIYLVATFMFSFVVIGEVLYRGIFLVVLRNKYGNNLGVFLASLLYSIGFGKDAVTIFAYIWLGLSMSYLYVKERNIYLNIGIALLFSSVITLIPLIN